MAETRLTCPVCQSRYTLEDAANSEITRQMVALAAKLGKCWDIAWEYAETFRQSQYGNITLKKRLRLLKEIARLWEACGFEYQGKRYRTDRRQILEGLNAVCNLDKFGFKNHNYLKAILLNGAKGISAEGLTAEEEARRESDRKTEAESRSLGVTDKPTNTTEAQQRLGALMDQIGGMP